MEKLCSSDIKLMHEDNLFSRTKLIRRIQKRPIFVSVVLFCCFLNLSAQHLNFAIGVGGQKNDRMTKIATDKTGNIYATGNFLGDIDFDPGQDTLLLEATGTSAVFISKFSKSGELIWANALQSPNGYSIAKCIEVDDSSNIYIAGTMRETVDFDPSEKDYLLSGGFNEDIFVAKYDSLCQLLWAFVITGSFNSDDIHSMLLDEDNNIYISGFVQASMDFDPGPGSEMLSASGITGYLAKYTPGGQFVYAGSIKGAHIQDLVIDDQNNIYLAGYFDGSVDLDMGNGQFMISSQGNRDWFLTRYNANLQFDWGFGIGNDQYDYIHRISLSADQQIIATGLFSNSITFDPENSTDYVESRGYNDIFMVAYDGSGRLIWKKTIGSDNSDDVMDMTIDQENNIIITGSYMGAIDMDPGDDNIYMPVMGLSSTYLGKYDSAGNYQAAYSLRASSGPSILALYSDLEDNLLIAGVYTGSIDLDLGSEVYMLPFSGTGGASFMASYRLNEHEPVDTGIVSFNEDLVKDIHPDSSSFPSNLTCFQQELYFLADDGNHGRELWKTDGSEENTQMVMDINPDGDAFLDDPRFVISNNKLYFIATDTTSGTELWVKGKDTKILKDISPVGDGCGPFTHYAASETVLYFTAKDALGIELWKTEGEEENTVKVKEINPHGDGVLSELAFFREKLYFIADDNIHGPQLWSSDGTDSGTAQFKELTHDTYDFSKVGFFVTDSILYFTLNDPGNACELWISNGSTEGTRKIKEFHPGTDSGIPSNFIQTDAFVFFTVNDSLYGTELWKTNGTEESTKLVSDIYPEGNGIPDNPEMLSVNNELYFTGEDNFFGLELWKTDGYDSTTRVLANINPGSDAFPNSLLNYNDEVYLAANNGEKWGIWRSREQGTDIQALRGLNSYGNNSPDWITYCNGVIYFTASDGTNGYELWKYKLMQSIGIDAEDSQNVIIKELDSLHYIGGICPDCSDLKSLSSDKINLQSSYYPKDVTDTTLFWSILAGDHLATIDALGTLTLTGQMSPMDTITVMLQADDGSKIYRRLDIVSDTTGLTGLVLIEPSSKNILFYPNPVSDWLHFKLQNQECLIELYDISGRRHNIMSHQSKGIHMLDMQGLPDGIYLIRILSDKVLYTDKIIKTALRLHAP